MDAPGPSAGTLPGAVLAQQYWEEGVSPLVRIRWPTLRVAAGRLGGGSDVLGLDDETSRDHDWGLRLSLCVEDGMAAPVAALLAERLPDSFAGFPTRFATTWDPRPSHRVECSSSSELLMGRLGVDPGAGLRPADWLAFTGQAVLEVTAGPLFVDQVGVLTRAREALRWYPGDLWRYVVGAAWHRIDQDLPLVGRTGQVGDEAGSRALAGRVAGTAVHLAFLLERRWPPYAKWRGTLLTRLHVGSALRLALAQVHAADRWQERQAALARALDVLLARQRAVGLPGGAVATQRFHDRPFLAVDPGTTRLLLDSVVDLQVRALPHGVGSVEQWVDSVDVLVEPARRRAAVDALLGARPAS